MSGFRTFLRLPSAERRLVLQSLLLASSIRISLWVIPFPRLLRAMRAVRLPVSVPTGMPVGRLVWAVQAASRRIPKASCLTQSLALQCLMARAGYASQVHIGVSRDAQAGFEAHAWVEYEGTALLSPRAEAEKYTRLLILNDRSA